MKCKVFSALTFLFGMLTLAGAIFIFSNGGEPDAGYAVIPALFCAAFANLARAAGQRANSPDSVTKDGETPGSDPGKTSE